MIRFPVSLRVRKTPTFTIIPSTYVNNTPVADRPIFSVTAPQTGNWHVDVSGTGTTGTSNYSVVVRGNSPIELERFEFVARSDPESASRASLAR